MKRRSLTLAAACLPAFAAAQDARQVAEPVMPAVCTTLKAMLDSPEAINADDTTRLQQAIDHCPAGQAVRLAGDNAHAFLSRPLVLRAGVGLAIDAGIILYASPDPMSYDKDKGSRRCGSNGARRGGRIVG